MKKKRLSSYEKVRTPRPAHTSLTHFLRRRWYRTPDALRQILKSCHVSADVGALPPELRGMIGPHMDVRTATARFRAELSDFLVNYGGTIRATWSAKDRVYELPGMVALFGITCQIECPRVSVYGASRWGGLTAQVCKMTFPALSTSYAFKIYHPAFHDHAEDHGAMFEIPTALAATYAEPKDNNRVYMASLWGNPYMLSAWAGDVEDGQIRKNQNEIFFMSHDEEQPRNYRQGRRIDYGETYRTRYGGASWRARKMYRSLVDLMRQGHVMAAWQLITAAQYAAKNTIAQRDCRDAMEILKNLNPGYAARLSIRCTR
ncbi:hypothetical protein HDR63_00185 [bacterium]|nr:hypothetical protein [bacterium]